MNATKNRVSPYRLLILGGLLALILLCGASFCAWVYDWWGRPPGPPPSEFIFVTVTPGPTINLAALPSTTPCGAPPTGWALYIVQPGDTLSELAVRLQISQGRIMQANCLTSPELLAGQQLYLPLLATPTPCPPPPTGWGLYLIQSGETLSTLAEARGISVDEAIRVNCLASPEIIAGQQLYLPVLPTATPCFIVQPDGWELYTVQTNDTLFSLAAARGTTTDEIMRVNCLASDIIAVGQRIYLPALPTPTPTEPPVAPPTEPPVVSPTEPPAVNPTEPPAVNPTEPPAVNPTEPLVVNPIEPTTVIPPEPTTIIPPQPTTVVPPQPTAQLFTPTPIPVSLISGGDWAGELSDKDKFEFTPCEGSPDERRLNTFDPTVELGQRLYVFTCNLTNPTSAMITRSDGLTESVELLGPTSEKLPPYIANKITGTVKAAIEWSALPTLTVAGMETYNLTVFENSSNSLPPVNIDIFVVPPERRHILVMPQAGLLFKTNFMVYYVNFTPSLTLTFDLYSQGQPSRSPEENKAQLFYRQSWQVPITQTLVTSNGPSGWAKMPLSLGPSSPNLYYAIGYKEEEPDDIKQPDWLFWVK